MPSKKTLLYIQHIGISYKNDTFHTTTNIRFKKKAKSKYVTNNQIGKSSCCFLYPSHTLFKI